MMKVMDGGDDNCLWFLSFMEYKSVEMLRMKRREVGSCFFLKMGENEEGGDEREEEISRIVW